MSSNARNHCNDWLPGIIIPVVHSAKLESCMMALKGSMAWLTGGRLRSYVGVKETDGWLYAAF